MRDCSFASVDRCHQLTFCKKKALRNVEENEKTVLGLRLNLPETDIQTVCYYHEQSLIVRFSNHIKKCSDPFSLHSRGPVTKSLWIVTLDFYSKTTSLKGIVAPGEKLCINCKKQAIIKSEHNLLVDESKDVTPDTDEALSWTIYITLLCSYAKTELQSEGKLGRMNADGDGPHDDKDIVVAKTVKSSENGDVKAEEKIQSPRKQPQNEKKPVETPKKLSTDTKSDSSGDEDSGDDVKEDVKKSVVKNSPEKKPGAQSAKESLKRKAERDSTDEKASKKLNSGNIDVAAVLDRGTKRESKKVERLSIAPVVTPKDKPLEIEDGSGDRLGDIEGVEKMLESTKVVDLKNLHHLLFKRNANPSDVKKHIRHFSGFTFDSESAEYKGRLAFLNKRVTNDLKQLCNVLHLQRGGTKENLVERIMEFLMKPKDSGLSSGRSVKKSGKRRSSSSGKKSKDGGKKEKKKQTAKKATTAKKVKKDSSKEASSSESEVSEDEKSEEEEEEEKSKAEKSKEEKSKAEKSKQSAKKRKTSESSDQNEDADDSDAKESKEKKRKVANKEKKKKSSDESDEGKDSEDDDDKANDSESDGSGEEFKPNKAKAKKGKTSSKKEKDKGKDKSKPAKAAKAKDTKAEKKPAVKSKKPVSDDSDSSEDEPLSKVEKKSGPPTDDDIKNFIKKVLTGANLEEITMKTVCTKVYDAYPGHDLTSRKEFIKAAVKDIIR